MLLKLSYKFFLIAPLKKGYEFRVFVSYAFFPIFAKTLFKTPNTVGKDIGFLQLLKQVIRERLGHKDFKTGILYPSSKTGTSNVRCVRR